MAIQIHFPDDLEVSRRYLRGKFELDREDLPGDEVPMRFEGVPHLIRCHYRDLHPVSYVEVAVLPQALDPADQFPREAFRLQLGGQRGIEGDGEPALRLDYEFTGRLLRDLEIAGFD